MRYLQMTIVMAALFLASCTPADEEYCSSFGVTQSSAEFGPCMQYYHQQTAQFNGDASVCSIQADQTYPQTLYDGWHTGYVNRFDPRSGAVFVDRVDTPPDMQHNAQVDALRMRIIQPCMDAKGWNSPTTWQVGRHAVKAHRPAPASNPTKGLPWLH